MFSEWLLSLRVKCQSIKCQCKNAQLHRRMHIYIHTQENLILHKPVNARKVSGVCYSRLNLLLRLPSNRKKSKVGTESLHKRI